MYHVTVSGPVHATAKRLLVAHMSGVKVFPDREPFIIIFFLPSFRDWTTLAA